MFRRNEHQENVNVQKSHYSTRSSSAVSHQGQAAFYRTHRLPCLQALTTGSYPELGEFTSSSLCL